MIRDAVIVGLVLYAGFCLWLALLGAADRRAAARLARASAWRPDDHRWLERMGVRIR